MGVFATPHVPGVCSLLEQGDVLLVCHKRPSELSWCSTMSPSGDAEAASRSGKPSSHLLSGLDHRPSCPTQPRACLQRVAAWGGRAHVGAMRCLDVTDEQWRRLEPLLP